MLLFQGSLHANTTAVAVIVYFFSIFFFLFEAQFFMLYGLLLTTTLSGDSIIQPWIIFPDKISRAENTESRSSWLAFQSSSDNIEP